MTCELNFRGQKEQNGSVLNMLACVWFGDVDSEVLRDQMKPGSRCGCLGDEEEEQQGR